MLNKTLDVYDADTWRPYCHVKDFAKFIEIVLNSDPEKINFEIFNAGSSENNFTKRANIIEGSSRALGWDTPSGQSSGGVYLSASSFGHTGFTGTSLWIDPENQIFVILLTNAVHPNRNYKNPNYFDWRQKIHSSVYEELGFSEKRNDLEWRERWIEN